MNWDDGVFYRPHEGGSCRKGGRKPPPRALPFSSPSLSAFRGSPLVRQGYGLGGNLVAGTRWLGVRPQAETDFVAACLMEDNEALEIARAMHLKGGAPGAWGDDVGSRCGARNAH